VKLVIMKTGTKKEDLGLKEKSIEKTMGTASAKPKPTTTTKPVVVKKPISKPLKTNKDANIQIGGKSLKV